MPWKPSAPGEVPTLGFLVIDWMTEILAAPYSPVYRPFVPYREQEEWLLRYYEIDPLTGRRRYRRGLLSRPRGWGKSPILAAMCAVEGLGPVVPAGWDADGQPVGRPWSDLTIPLVQIAAVSDDQTANTYRPLQQMLLDGAACDEYPGLEPMDTFVALPGGGRIEKRTSSGRAIKGSAEVKFAALDQTEEWTKGNGGHKLYESMSGNATKTDGSFVESPNAYTQGEDSVAERSAKAYKQMRDEQIPIDDLCYDHREAPPETDLEVRESIVAGLRVSYGDSSGHPDGCVIHTPPCPPGHQNLESQAAQAWNPQIPESVYRADFLNQINESVDQWLRQVEVKGVRDYGKHVEPGDTIVLGFDGSRKRKRGVTDATALIGCRVSDGHIFQLAVWEQPEGPKGKGWEVPTFEVDTAVRAAFATYRVIGLYCDPAKWETWVSSWEADFHDQLLVKASRDHPAHWWMTGGRSNLIVRATEQLYTAITSRQCTIDGAFTLVKHLLNARIRNSTSGVQIAKEFPDSPNKIDAAVAAILAWQARLDAFSKGLHLEAAEEDFGSYSF